MVKFVTGVAMTDPSFYVALARAAEQAGFDVITVPDSICYPQASNSKYPYTPDGKREFLENKPFIEPMVAMAAMAAVTERIELVTNVIKLPIRHPVIFAKELSSLAVLSGGRVALGAGTSPWPDDYAVVNLPWEGRARRFDECVTIIRGLLSGDFFEFRGEFYDFDAIRLNPVPTDAVPILVGGHSDALVERAARLGDGWMPAGLDAQQISKVLGRIAARRSELGRTGPFAVYGACAPEPGEIRRLEDAGVTHVVSGYFGTFRPYGTDTDTEPLQDKIDRLQRFGDEVIAKLR